MYGKACKKGVTKWVDAIIDKPRLMISVEQVGREAKDLGELRTRVEATSAGGWQEVSLFSLSSQDHHS